MHSHKLHTHKRKNQTLNNKKRVQKTSKNFNCRKFSTTQKKLTKLTNEEIQSQLKKIPKWKKVC